MAMLDHLILKVNDLQASLAFYTDVLGFTAEGTDGPFVGLRVGPHFQIQMAPWGTPGSEHYAFAGSGAEFDRIFDRIKVAGIDYGRPFASLGPNRGPGSEAGPRGFAPTFISSIPTSIYSRSDRMTTRPI